MSYSRVALTYGITLLVAGCASTPGRAPIAHSKTAASLVVGKLTGKIDQPTVEICSRNGASGGVAIPSTIVWVAEDPAATLTIDFPDRAQKCIVGVHCSGNVCNAISNTNVHGGNVQCEYHVSLNGTQTDPIIVVDDCCP